ncbi:hypothetical protein BASA60_008438 [Batrachochytrium salamandrivorans]|nr:hypothetical protein BASA60_008438 [Batrachochytrium salamandrivorans]
MTPSAATATNNVAVAATRFTPPSQDLIVQDQRTADLLSQLFSSPLNDTYTDPTLALNPVFALSTYLPPNMLPIEALSTSAPLSSQPSAAHLSLFNAHSNMSSDTTTTTTSTVSNNSNNGTPSNNTDISSINAAAQLAIPTGEWSTTGLLSRNFPQGSLMPQGALDPPSMLPSPTPSISIHPQFASPMPFSPSLQQCRAANPLPSHVSPAEALLPGGFLANYNTTSSAVFRTPYMDGGFAAPTHLHSMQYHHHTLAADKANVNEPAPASVGSSFTSMDWISPISMSRDGSSFMSHPALIKSSPMTPQVVYSDALRAFAGVAPQNSVLTAAALRSDSRQPETTAEVTTSDATSSTTSAASRKRKERSMDREELVAEIEDKRRRNTESARRSRERKASRLEELEALTLTQEARIAELESQIHKYDPVQCNTLRDEWSRLKAAATQLERVDGRKQWVKHADNLDRAVSDGRTDLVFSAARAMSGNSSRSAAVTPLYNSDGIVQYDPTSILRVMQAYSSLSNTPTIRNSDILDQDFSWNQIAAALLQMSPRKAPGDDGITTAFYQAALYMPANTQEGVPPTPFARALLRVCGQVFASATIPRAWLCASIVSIDKKDGDPLNPGDKRGIALINVGLKLVCKVLQMRIERFVETNNLLSYEQAGFRKREECVGQVVSLVDIIQRRQNAGLNTHVLFIDIRKAFDTVPVGALLWKLQNMGFPRRTLAFLKALYTSSSARARAGSLLSDPFPVQRGFPGLPRDTNPIRGLMYADDVAVFADSEQSLLAASTAIEQWANQWEMQFGVAKCGIISFTGHLAPRLDNPLDIRLHGQLVSRVESYKYLGVLIDSKLDHSAWLKQKRSALEHTISALHPVLANHQLTVNYRSRIFSAVVMGKAYYGLELVGGNKSHLAPLQTTINKGIRLFTGARLSTAIGPLLVETGIGSLLTRSLVSRLVRSQRWFWSRRTKQLYRNRYWLTPQVRPKTVKQRHSFALMETLRTCGDSASLQNTGHRIQSGLVPAIQKSRLRLLGRALDPGVENVYTWLRGGVLNGEADLDQRWLDGTVEHESMGTRHDNRALAARLADFLQVAYRQYQSTLWKYHRDRLVEVG